MWASFCSSGLRWSRVLRDSIASILEERRGEERRGGRRGEERRVEEKRGEEKKRGERQKRRGRSLHML